MATTKKLLVEKRNVLNEIRSNNMTLQELRFFCIYLSRINARDESTRKVRFSVDEFAQIMDCGRMNIEHLKATTDNLLTKIIHIPEPNAHGQFVGGWSAFQLFKRCKVNQVETGEWFVDMTRTMTHSP
jgi:hypothetical protein